MKKKITKSKVIQNCTRVAAGVVLAGGIGFHFHEKHELNEEITALKGKQSAVVHELKVAHASVGSLQQQTLDLSHQKEKLQKQASVMKDANAELKDANTALQEKNRQLQSDLEAERNRPRPVEKKETSASTTSSVPRPSQTETSQFQPEPKQASATKVVYGTASAYTASCKGCTGVTASGDRVQPGMVAMAAWVPLGTEVRITSKSAPHVNGVYTVADRGGAIKGNRVDIYMDSKSEAIDFGKRGVKIEILD